MGPKNILPEFITYSISQPYCHCPYFYLSVQAKYFVDPKSQPGSNNNIEENGLSTGVKLLWEWWNSRWEEANPFCHGNQRESRRRDYLWVVFKCKLKWKTNRIPSCLSLLLYQTDTFLFLGWPSKFRPNPVRPRNKAAKKLLFRGVCPRGNRAFCCRTVSRCQTFR